MTDSINKATDKLLKAYEQGYANASKEAIEQGADVNVKDRNGCSLLHNACEDGSVYLVELLLDNGADVNVKDNDGNTALHNACFLGHFYKAKLLLEYGADLTIKNNQNKTPYDEAVIGASYCESVVSCKSVIPYDKVVVAESDGYYFKQVKQLLTEWQLMEQNGTRPPSKKPTFGGKVNPSIQTTANSVAPTPEQQAEELKKTYLNLSSTEITKCLLSTDDFAKVQKIFSGNLEPLVKKMTHQEAMRVYVHIYKKLTPIEKATYQKGVVALQKQQKAKIIKRKEYEASK